MDFTRITDKEKDFYNNASMSDAIKPLAVFVFMVLLLRKKYRIGAVLLF